MLFVLYSFLREDCPLFHIEFKIRKFRIDLVEVYELRTKEYVFLHINIHLINEYFQNKIIHSKLNLKKMLSSSIFFFLKRKYH